MFKGRHFDRSVILLCVRWYLAYSLSLRDLEEMMAERGIFVDHATVHRWTVHYAPLLLELFNRRKRPVTGKWTRRISRCVVNGGISTAPPTAMETRSSSGSVSGATSLLPNGSFAELSSGMAGRSGS